MIFVMSQREFNDYVLYLHSCIKMSCLQVTKDIENDLPGSASEERSSEVIIFFYNLKYYIYILLFTFNKNILFAITN